LPFCFPLGKISSAQGGYQASYSYGLAGQHSYAFIFITPGRGHEINLPGELIFEPGAMDLFDGGRWDLARLPNIPQSPAFFIIHAKRNFRFRRLFSQQADKAKGIQADSIIQLHGFYSHRDDPDRLRRIRTFEAEKQKRLVFLTNNLTLPALTIAELFRCRWRIELFFK